MWSLLLDFECCTFNATRSPFALIQTNSLHAASNQHGLLQERNDFDESITVAADLVIFTKSLHPVRPSAHHLVEPSRRGNYPCRNGYQIDCYLVEWSMVNISEILAACGSRHSNSTHCAPTPKYSTILFKRF